MKILIVEDDIDSRILLERTLPRQGYSIESAANGVEALQKAVLSPPDLIISDIMMPEMDGFELCRRIKADERLRTIPFVFYTSTYIDQKDERLAMALGASRFLIKPMKMEEFFDIIGEVIEKHRAEHLPVLDQLPADMTALDRMQVEVYARKLQEKVRELSGKIETIKAMAMLDREILSTIDRVTILKAAVAMVSRIIPCERAAILFREGENYRVISEWGVGRFLDNVYSVRKSHFDALGMTSTSLFIPDVAADGADCLYHREQNAIGIKSSLMVPLVTKGETIGLLDIGSTFHGRLAPEHLSAAVNIASQITVALENAMLYEDLQQLLVGTISSLAAAIDAKSPWTNGHSERVTQYAVEIGKELGLKDHDLEMLRLSALLHDVGKIGTYDIVLDKPGKLTEEEFALVKKHPKKGAEILAPIKQLIDVIPGVLHHHERYDGKGYPDGLKEEDIPLQARILCIADSFDAMTADRPYRTASGKDYAISEIKRWSGTQFDPKVVAVFLRVLDRLSI